MRYLLFPVFLCLQATVTFTQPSSIVAGSEAAARLNAFQEFVTQLNDVVAQLETDVRVVSAKDPALQDLVGALPALTEDLREQLPRLLRWIRKDPSDASVREADRVIAASGLREANSLFLSAQRESLSLEKRERLVGTGVTALLNAAGVFELLAGLPPFQASLPRLSRGLRTLAKYAWQHAATSASLTQTQEKLNEALTDLRLLEVKLDRQQMDGQRIETKLDNGEDSLRMQEAKLDQIQVQLDQKHMALQRQENKLDMLEAKLDRKEAKLDQIEMKLDSSISTGRLSIDVERVEPRLGLLSTGAGNDGGNRQQGYRYFAKFVCGGVPGPGLAPAAPAFYFTFLTIIHTGARTLTVSPRVFLGRTLPLGLPGRPADPGEGFIEPVELAELETLHIDCVDIFHALISVGQIRGLYSGMIVIEIPVGEFPDSPDLEVAVLYSSQ